MVLEVKCNLRFFQLEKYSSFVCTYFINMDQTGCYEVDAIINHQLRQNKGKEEMYYMIQWKGYLANEVGIII